MISGPKTALRESFLTGARKVRHRGSKGLSIDDPRIASYLDPAERILRLARSIAGHGFEPRDADGDLGGRFLVANGRWHWLPTAGMHRVPVAAALRVREFTVRVIFVVKREESSIWPHVRTGLFSERAALLMFDRLLGGRPPACASAWTDWVEGQSWHEA